MSHRFYLRTSSAIGPLWYADGAGSPNWTMERSAAYPFPSALAARLWRNGLGLTPADCRVVRVGPKRPAAPAEKAPPAAPVTPGRADGPPDGSTPVPTPAARPEGNGGPPDPGGLQVGDVWELFGGGERYAIAAGPSPDRVSVRRVSALGLGREEGPWLAHDTGGLRLVSRAGQPWPPRAS